MSSVVMDSSAILALLCNEPGKETVLEHLQGAFISSVNIAEVYARATELNLGLEPSRRALAGLHLREVMFGEELAFISGTLRGPTKAAGLSLGDRACLALGLSRGLPVLTGDKQWMNCSVGVEVILFR